MDSFGDPKGDIKEVKESIDGENSWEVLIQEREDLVWTRDLMAEVAMDAVGREEMMFAWTGHKDQVEEPGVSWGGGGSACL